MKKTTPRILAGVFELPAIKNYFGPKAPVPVTPSEDEDDEDLVVETEPPKTGLTPDDLHKAAAKARSDERTKIREEISALQNEVEQQKAANTLKDKQIKDLTDKLAAITAASTDASGKALDVAKLLETYTEKARQASSTESSAREAELKARLDKLERENLAMKTETLRSSLIEQAGGSDVMVVELVSGESSEQILASIETAKAAFDRIVAKAGGKPKKQKAKEEELEEDIELPEVPETKPRESGPAKTLSGVKSLSAKEYKARREEILREHASKHGSGARPFGSR